MDLTLTCGEPSPTTPEFPVPHTPPTPELARRCMRDLSTYTGDLAAFIPTFFGRECSNLVEEERDEVLCAAYDLCWERIRELDEEVQFLQNCAPEGSEAAVTGLLKRSERYFDIIRTIGAYLLQKQQEQPA